MNTLPDEILLMIFDNLPLRILWSIISRVCRRWEIVVSHRIVAMRNNCEVFEMHSGIVGVYLPRIRASSPLSIDLTTKLLAINLRELIIGERFPLGEIAMKSINSNRTLRHLDVFAEDKIKDLCLPPSQINSIVLNHSLRPPYISNLSCYNKINALHMYGYSYYYSTMEMGMFVKAQALHLTHLTLRCHEMRDSRWAALGLCTNLLQLQLYACWSVTAAGVQHVVQLPALQVLHLTGCRMVRSQALFTVIERLSPAIVELNLSASTFSGRHVQALGCAAPRLRRLELWRCDVAAQHLLALAAALASLAELDCDVQLSGGDVARLGEHPALRELRCCLKEPVKSRLHLRSATSPPPVQTRGGGEGPSADTFLHCEAYRPIDTDLLDSHSNTTIHRTGANMFDTGAQGTFS